MLTLMVSLVVLSVLPLAAQEAETHIVRPGESLFRIAQQYGVSVSDLAGANDIVYTWRILAGDVLVIPGREAASTSNSSSAAPAENTDTEYHTVGYGESLGVIATRYGMTLTELARLNDITNPDLIYIGQRLIISTGESSPALNAIADSAPEASVSELSIQPNTIPIIPGFSVVMPPVQPTADPLAGLENAQRHVVSYGESLSGIANRYGVSMLAITQANNIYNPNQIMIGQELIIPERTQSTPADVGISTVIAAPAARLTIGREIIVDLSEQRVYAYENGILVRNVLVSTGLPATPTVRGEFTVQRKYSAQTMTGPGYYLPDVPYILYFYAGYALHGTYWHSNFGQPMSHGCVNLPTPEAEWFFNWADVGTPVYVQV
jgi:LysM repeat protein